MTLVAHEAMGALPVHSYSFSLFVNNFNRQRAWQMYRQRTGLRIHSTLRRDEWEDLDRMVVDIGKENLRGVMALRTTPGLLRMVSIAKSLAEYNRMSTLPASTITMNPIAEGQRGQVDFALAATPVPFAFNDFQLDLPTLAASRQYGEGLDMLQGAEATYQVTLAWETMLFNGTPALGVSDRAGTLHQIAGYTTYSDRNTGTALGDWDDATNGHLYVFETIAEMKRALRDDQFHGPYWLYVNSANWADLQLVNAQTDIPPIDVLRRDPELQRIEYSPRLASGELVMLDPKPRTVRWVERFMIRPVEWDEKGGLGTNFRVIGSGAPEIKSTYSGQCGVAHWSGAGT